MNRLLAFGLAVFLFAAPAAAQTGDAYFGEIASQLDRGERATVWTMSGEKVRGRVIGVSGDAIDLRRNGRDIRLLAQDVRRVERAGDRLWDGAGIGGAIGLVVGAVSMATCDPGFFCDNSLPSVLACGGLAAGFGFGVGALGDWLIRPDRVIFDRGDGAAADGRAAGLDGEQGSDRPNHLLGADASRAVAWLSPLGPRVCVAPETDLLARDVCRS